MLGGEASPALASAVGRWPPLRGWDWAVKPKISVREGFWACERTEAVELSASPLLMAPLMTYFELQISLALLLGGLHFGKGMCVFVNSYLFIFNERMLR